MADWRDVMEARSNADGMGSEAAEVAATSRVTSGERGIITALLAVKEEIRALGVTINYGQRNQ